MPRSTSRLRQSSGIRLSINQTDAIQSATEFFQNKVDQLRAKIDEIASKSSKPVTTGIIGAGFAGMFSAFMLNHNPKAFKVSVIEANPNRIGGRVWTRSDFSPGRLIEFGAELIGIIHPLWINTAKQFGIGLSALTSQDYYDSIGLPITMMINGKNLTPEEIDSVETEINNAITNRFVPDAQLISHPDQPWLDLSGPNGSKIREWDDTSLSTVIASLNLSPQAQLIFDAEWSNNNVSSTSNQSYLGILCEIANSGQPSAFWDGVETHRCSDGNMALAYKMSTNVNITLNHPVCKIAFTRDTNHRPSVFVDGTSYDMVIVAVSPNHFTKAKHSISFQGPKFPIASYMPMMGPAMKIMAEMDTRFWILGIPKTPGSKSVGPMISNSGQSPNAWSNQSGEAWEATENQTVTTSLVASNPLPRVTLSLFAGGSQAIENLSDQQETIQRLNQMFPGYQQNLNDKSTLKNPYFQDWSHDEYIEAGYSCYGVGQVLTIGKNLHNFVPEWGNTLIFAGEHTSVNFTGYMEGALQSGLRAALQIVNDTAATLGLAKIDTNLSVSAKTELSVKTNSSADTAAPIKKRGIFQDIWFWILVVILLFCLITYCILTIKSMR